MNQIEQTIVQSIREEFLADQPERTLTVDEPLVEGGIVDSLGIFLLIEVLEREFGIKVQPQDVVIENFDTVAAISRLVALRRSEGELVAE